MTHYYSEEQTSLLKINKIKADIKNKEIWFYTASGIFSSKKLDRGSFLLIDNAVIKSGMNILDLGCGNGIVGICLSLLNDDIKVVFTDINKRAVMITKMNIKLNKIKNAKVFQGDGFEKIKTKFDVILFNPPQTAGKELCFGLIEESKSFLNSGGSLQLVARHQKGGKELKKKMFDVFGNVEEISKGSGYRVYLSENKKKR